MMIFEIVALGLPLIAVILSFHAQSRVSVFMLRWCGGYFLVSMSISLFMELDCEFSDFAFQRCRFTPDVIADVLTVPHLINLMLLVSAGPVLVLVALGFELRKRSARSHAGSRQR
ncbi:hypothetical protein [Hoeflea sp.]|uniref:hypothetical protein n=1 Tax=Hoeflea sp. TaxID=1940281 RepID=UPI003A907B6A